MSTHLRQPNDSTGPSRIMQDLKSYSTSTSSPLETASGSAHKRSTRSWNIGRRPHVIVIGAGVAGLHCAEVLLEAGIEVTVLEGRDRVGGRLHQIEQGGYTIDMGANWIHGTVDNPILDLAKATKTQVTSVGEDIGFFNEYGCQIFNKAKAQELHEMVWGIISDAFKFSNENAASIPPTKNLYEFMRDELHQRDLAPEDYRTAMYMAEQWGHFIGDHFSLQSLKYFWMEECLEGENLFVAGSYKAILERIFAKVQAEANLRLGHIVGTVGTILQSNPPRTMVYHKTGVDSGESSKHQTECDAVVITVPLGCLKRDLPAIHRKPTEEIRAAIKALGFGQLEKAYFTFPKAWWNTGPNGPSFFQFLHPLYDQENPTNAIIDCMDLSLLPGATAQPTLLFYFHGPFAYGLTLDLERFEGYEAEAEQFLARRFRTYFRLLPNFDPEDPACNPIAACMTRWHVDPLSLGSYTNFPISGMKGCLDGKMDKSVETLRHGMPERGIYFAGEHTAPFVAVGTVTGAYWSGEKVAERIVESFAKETENGATDTK